MAYTPTNRPLPYSQSLSNIVDKLTNDGDARIEEAIDQQAAQKQDTVPNVISQIEDIFESIANAILMEEPHLVIKIKTRYKAKSHFHDPTSGVIRRLPDDGLKAVKFPSRKPHEAWKFGECVDFEREQCLLWK